MREMIIDIDNRETVQAAMEQVSKGWFNPVEMYANLKFAGKTDSSGFELFRQLRDVWECLEVFPQAIVVLRLQAGSVHKSKREGLRSQLQAAARFTGWPRSPAPASLFNVGYGSLHDKLDAYVSAWVASLADTERVGIGKIPADMIWVPAMPNPALHPSGRWAVGERPRVSPGRSTEKA